MTGATQNSQFGEYHENGEFIDLWNYRQENNVCKCFHEI